MAREQGLATEELGTDTAGRPDVNRRGVACKIRANQLRSAVPACRDVVGPEDRVLAYVSEVRPAQEIEINGDEHRRRSAHDCRRGDISPGQAEVTDF